LLLKPNVEVSGLCGFIAQRPVDRLCRWCNTGTFLRHLLAQQRDSLGKTSSEPTPGHLQNLV
jgi:type II secretory ATPase GspE/PulE/Tfp pilus assembly ATPase PilB-like protein